MRDDDSIDTLVGRLANISPMPPDEEVSEESLIEYEDVIHSLEQHQNRLDDDSLQVVVDSFGYGTGFGLYWSTVSLLEGTDYQRLVPILIKATAQKNPGIRMWAAILLGRTRDKTYTQYISKLLGDEMTLVRLYALIALGLLSDESVKERVKEMLKDPSDEVRSRAEKLFQKLNRA